MKLVSLMLGFAVVAGPSGYAVARQGTLQVTSGAVVTPKTVEMRGAWNDTSRSCSARRRLSVRAEVAYDQSGKNFHRVVLSKTFEGANCLKGGPDVGFTPTAKLLVLACPDGTWKPGVYRFQTTTTDTVTRLKATATLSWTQTARC